MVLPGWNSPATIAEIHDALEAIALVFFAALVVFDVLAHLKTKREHLFTMIALTCFAIAIITEIAAYPYGRRNDELSQIRIREQDAAIAQLHTVARDADMRARKYQIDTLAANQRAMLAGLHPTLIHRPAKKLKRVAAADNSQLATSRPTQTPPN